MRFGLFARLALSITALLCAALLTLGYVLMRDAEEHFLHEHASLARAQAETLADGSVDALITGDYELLVRWVAAVTPADFYAYAYLAKPDGQVLTHTDIQETGHYLYPLGELDGPFERDVRHLERPVHEVIEPVILGEKYLANAVVAYYTDARPDYIDQASLGIVFVLGVFLSLLLGATLWLIRRHTQPLTELADTITATSLSAASVRRPDKRLLMRHDEVGALAREYDKLLDRLAQSYRSLQDEELRLRKMVEDRTHTLQQSNQELEAFSYSVSHDLRAPLRAIDGFCQILAEDYAGRLDEAGLDYLARVRAGSRNMAQLIDDLLSLSRVTRASLCWKPVDLSALVERAFGTLREQYPGRDVAVRIAGNIVVRGDATLLGVAVDNLIGNAWKYTGKTKHARIEFGVDDAQGDRVYFVRDNGAGFDMDYVDKLFGTFQRLHRAGDFEGTGIGLATVKRVIQRHFGRIWAQAEPGSGATFYFTLGDQPTQE